ncbi:FAD-dependent oxidoreductase [Sulfobacillus harzensis]|uniref:NAD(P)-binding protein n=1 Tax=Sulfobacillus harzensis TaxID=2729629 RepID=A0A7Y0Q4Z8_9FIRM|nr:NAD(P)-binding protein [Sulfobacillus harzensis]
MRIAVIGGGISGLATCYALERQTWTGHAPVMDLYEAEMRLGGVIETVRFGRAVIEMGPDSLVDKPDGVVALAQQLGLGGDLAQINPGAAPPLWLKVDGWHPFPHRETRSYTLLGGLDQLTEALTRALRSTHISLGARVSAISSYGQQWLVEAEPKVEGIYDAVVLALPTVAALPLLSPTLRIPELDKITYPARAVVGVAP